MGCSCSSNFSGTEEAQSEQLTNELYEQWLLAEGSAPTCCEHGGKCPEGFHCVDCNCIPQVPRARKIPTISREEDAPDYSNASGFGGQNIKRGLSSMVPWVVLAVSLGVGLYVSNLVIKKYNKK